MGSPRHVHYPLLDAKPWPELIDGLELNPHTGQLTGDVGKNQKTGDLHAAIFKSSFCSICYCFCQETNLGPVRAPLFIDLLWLPSLGPLYRALLVDRARRPHFGSYFAVWPRGPHGAVFGPKY